MLKTVLSIGLAGLLLTTVGCWSKPPSAAPAAITPVVQPKSDRVLAILIPGTYGNETFWPNVIEGKATFGSELLRALPLGSEVRPFLWASSVQHENRLEAASNLAELIDDQAEKFDRVCLVGHSHGGNVALLAAARCRAKIDLIVCMSTPHPCLLVKSGAGEEMELPIYCSPQTLQNANAVVTLCHCSDAVPEFWSNELLIGLTENNAIALTKDWRVQKNFPRLQRDRLLPRLLESGNIHAAKTLAPAHANLEILSLVEDRLGVESHSTIHSRRMGYLVGQLLSEGPSEERLEHLRSLVQPPTADQGGPIASDEHQQWLQEHEHEIEHSGWLLTEVEITCDESTPKDFDGSLADPMLVLKTTQPKQPTKKTESQSNTLHAVWKPGFFVARDDEFRLAVHDSDLVSSDSLGEHALVADGNLPEVLESDPKQGIYWKAKLTWQAAHY